MNVQHLACKVFADGQLDVEWERFIHVFHQWVASQSMPEMMIDVADYRHVPNGPGVVMVGHEADYYMDNAGGAPGLRYVCKAAKPAGFEEQLRQAVSAAIDACSRIEREVAGVRFSRKDFEISINDRALAPNDEETRARLEKELPTICQNVFGTHPVQITCQQDSRKLAGARVTLTEDAALVP